MKKKAAIFGLCLGWFAVIAQLILMFQNRQADSVETIIRFFSFFTILTNILVALYFTRAALGFKSFRWLLSPGSITAITAFILIVGLVYQVALRSVWQPTGWQRIVDELLHTVIPLYAALYWGFKVQKQDLDFKRILWWLLYPLIYLVFILIRGSFSGFYPYPFLNVAEIGYEQALLNISIVCAVTCAMFGLLLFIGRLIISKQQNVISS